MTDETVESRPARISVAVGYTLNMGDFESLRVDFSVERSKTQKEAGIDEAIDNTFDYLSEKLVTKINDVKRELKKG